MKKIYEETKIIIISLPEYINDERETLRSRKIHRLENIIQVEKIDDNYLVFEYLDSASGNTLDILTKMGDVSQIYETTSNSQKQEKLLKLYQKYYHDYDDLTLDEEVDIYTQIKELENE